MRLVRISLLASLGAFAIAGCGGADEPQDTTPATNDDGVQPGDTTPAGGDSAGGGAPVETGDRDTGDQPAQPDPQPSDPSQPHPMPQPTPTPAPTPTPTPAPTP